VYIIISILYLFSSFKEDFDKDSYQLNPSENIDDLEMDIENSDTHSEIISSLKNVDNNIENFKDDENDIEIEEFENADTQLYGKDFEPKVF